MEYLVVTAIGPHNPTMISQLSLLAAKNDCNIEESHITVMGTEFALMMLLSGNWNTVAKFENTLPSFEKEFELAIKYKRTKPEILSADYLPYEVQISGLDHPGIIYSIVDFLVQQNVIVGDLQSTNFTADLTGATMLSLVIRIGVSSESNISEIREQFAYLCDDLNLDGMIEPEKH